MPPPWATQAAPPWAQQPPRQAVPQAAGPWPPYGGWQQPQGSWVWNQSDGQESAKKIAKKRPTRQTSSESSEDSSEDSDEKEKKKKKKEKGKNWEKETPKPVSYTHLTLPTTPYV